MEVDRDTIDASFGSVIERLLLFAIVYIVSVLNDLESVKCTLNSVLYGTSMVYYKVPV